MFLRERLLLLTLFLLFPISFTSPTPAIAPPTISQEPCHLAPNNNPRITCLVVTLAHKGIFDIDIYNQTCHLVGWARSASYSKKAKILTTLTKKRGKNWVYVKPEGMQGTLQPGVRYAGIDWGDNGVRGREDKDTGSWVSTVDFGC